MNSRRPSFEHSIIIYLAQVPGYFSAAWCNERLDRPRTVAIYLVGAAVSALALSQLDTSAAIVATGALLSFFLNGVYAGLYAYTPEVFPTWVRATDTELSIYLASTDKYEDSFLPNGTPSGSPEEALDCACGLYLGDPTAWQQPPTN